jgi:hypothetical protein
MRPTGRPEGESAPKRVSAKGSPVKPGSRGHASAERRGEATRARAGAPTMVGGRATKREGGVKA